MSMGIAKSIVLVIAISTGIWCYTQAYRVISAPFKVIANTLEQNRVILSNFER